MILITQLTKIVQFLNRGLKSAESLIIGNTVVGDSLKGGFILKENNPLRKELFSLYEIQNIKREYHKKVSLL